MKIALAFSLLLMPQALVAPADLYLCNRGVCVMSTTQSAEVFASHAARSISDVAEAYQTDQDSTFQRVRFYTRKFYSRQCRRLCKDHGDVLISDIKARTTLSWHADWSENGEKIPMAHSLMGVLRTVVNFGATYLEDPDCIRLSAVLHRQRFPQGKPRGEAMTFAQAQALCAEARRQGFGSIALAQALEFEGMFRQKDAIGEYVPISEPGTSDIIRGNEKWLRGLRWNEIDRNLILRHVTSKRQKEITIDLKNAPLVLREIALLTYTPIRSAPIVICEKTGLPWDAAQFRRKWRELARAVGIPDTIRNMDSRAGAITEATNAGADLEHVRHAATHSDIGMTQRYSRGDADKTAMVQAARLEHRKRA